MLRPSISQVRKVLRRYAKPERARVHYWFFKTGPGQYGEGDQFLGLTVPETRFVAKQFYDLPLPLTEQLLQSPIHDERFLALAILVGQFQTATITNRHAIVRFYLKNLNWVNNWDLVDASADKILGAWLYNRQRSVLTKLARSKNMWHRRVAIVSTFAFIRQGDFKDTIRISKILLNDQHDLIHKASGWMLREVGKRDVDVLRKFLNEHRSAMPRTMLRYAIEKFSPAERKRYLAH